MKDLGVYLVTMVENNSDGDIENGMCEPDWFEDLIEADSKESATRIANEKWDSCGCTNARLLSKEEVESYNNSEE